MEQSLSSLLPDDYLEELFGIRQKDYSQYSPASLAFLGDSVYELIIRSLIVRSCDRQAWKLHNESSRLVRAAAQCDIIRAIEPDLTAEERAVYRRGRNSDPKNTAKNATREEYLEATGFEALLGYLYLTGRKKRMFDLVKLGFERTGNEI